MAEDKNTLWVITELYYPEMTSTGYYLTKIAEGLAADRTVKVICGQPNYSAKGVTAPKREFMNGVEIFRCWGTRLDKNVIPFRVLNMLSLGAAVFFKLLRQLNRGDRVLVVTTPPLMPFVAAAAALIKKTSYILLIHDNYPDLLVAVQKTRSDSMFVRLASRANRWLYKHTSKIIVVGRDMAQLVSRKSAGLNVPVVTIPNWAELETVTPRPRHQNHLLKELGFLDKFVFLYAGNMGHPNDVESILEAARILKEDDAIHFLFLGEGVKRRWIEKQIEADNLTNVSLLPPMPRSEQNVFLNACDVGIVTLVTGMLGVSMPSRTYNLMAAGKPILAICEQGSELEQVVTENNIGWTVRPGNSSLLAEKVREITGNRSGLRSIGKRSSDAAMAQYSLEVALDKYGKEIR